MRKSDSCLPRLSQSEAGDPDVSNGGIRRSFIERVAQQQKSQLQLWRRFPNCTRMSARPGQFKNHVAHNIDDVCSPPIAALARLGAIRQYPRKSLLVKEGEAGDTLFVLLEGRMRIFAEDQDEHRFVIGIYGPGTLFGEGSLDGGPRTASVEAVSDLVCSVLPYAELKAAMARDPVFAMALLTELIARGRATARRMKSLALDSVYQRLLALIAIEGVERDGVRTLGPDWSQQEIANRLGSSRDMVTKIFRELAKGGYIAVGRGETRILRPLPKAW